MNSIEPLSDFWAESYIRLGKRSFLYFGNKVIISCYVVTIFFVFWLMVGFLASQSYANVWGDGWPGLGCDQHRHKLETENITQFRENISFEYSQPSPAHTAASRPPGHVPHLGKINKIQIQPWLASTPLSNVFRVLGSTFSRVFCKISIKI